MAKIIFFQERTFFKLEMNGLLKSLAITFFAKAETSIGDGITMNRIQEASALDYYESHLATTVEQKLMGGLLHTES